MKRLLRGVGYDIRETADTVSLVIDKEQADDDQFQISHFEADGKHWFTIKPGYATTMDHGTWGPDSTVSSAAGVIDVSSIGKTKIELYGYGCTNNYKVESCNAYGYKRKSDKGNKLTENSFAPDTDSHRTICVFLYRHTPGYGVPKLAVCSWPTMRDHFLDSSNCSPVTNQTPLSGCPPVLALRVRYENVTISGVTFRAVSPATTALDITEWFGIGTHIQLLGFYDKTDKRLYQVKKGHVRMDSTPTTIGREQPTGSYEDPIIYNTGWHAYFYSGAGGTSTTGLTFANPPAQATGQPPFNL